MRHDAVHWQGLHTFNPAAIAHDGKVYLFFRAEDDTGTKKIGSHTSRVGLATSDDGVHFTRRAEPVLYPDEDDQKANEWDGGCEDPRVIAAADGSFVMTYTQWNHKLPRLATASSRDLIHWTKHGPVFAADSVEAKAPSKSGAILGKLNDSTGSVTAEKVNGSYWMYWGEGDVKLAKSDDLIHWTTLHDATDKPLLMLPKRPGHFDSSLAEAGPPAIMTDRGIVVLYNGRNGSGTNADPDLPTGTYAAGEALFDAHDPSKLLERDEQPIFKPEKDFERTGQYVAGTTFTEGLVKLHDRWFVYYGCADSFVGVASASQN